ncbi:MAG: NTP transferase domain-containing protein [Acidobacteriota bacterium]|nr:NTP transferase domain-containing protein [Acidobacteriota bacterium]
MDLPPIPLIILGGRDRRRSQLPDQDDGQQPLKGYKAVELRIGDRPLICHVLDRWRATGAFDPIFVAGPAQRYRDVCPGVELVDTDGDFGQNIRTGLEAVIARCGRCTTAVTTCDVLPVESELAVLLEDFRQRSPLDFWMPQIRVPTDPHRLGASEWKPRYRIAPRRGEEPEETLPGHLVIADVAAVRLDLMYRMFELAYRTRNHPVAYRKRVIARTLLFWLVSRDLRSILRLQLPTLTFQAVRYGTALARDLAGGTIDADRLAQLVHKLYIRRPHRRNYPQRRGFMPVLDGLSLAKDIDTEGEAREIAEQVAQAAAPRP